MNKQLSIALLIIGIVLISWGVSTTESFVSDIPRRFMDSPTDMTNLLMVCGLIVAIVGIYGLIHKSIKY